MASWERIALRAEDEKANLLKALKLVVEYHVPKINPLSDAAILSAREAIRKAEGK